MIVQRGSILVLFLGVSVFTSAQVEETVRVSRVEDRALFIQEADLIVPTTSADLIIDIDLQKTGERLKKSKQLTKALTRNLKEATRYRILSLCDQDLQRWQRIAAQVGDHAGDRRKERFLATLGTVFASAVAGVTGFLWGLHQDHETLRKVAKEQGAIIRVVAEEEQRLEAMVSHARMQDSMLAHLDQREQLLEHEVQAVGWVLAALAAQDRELSRLEDIVSGVIASNKITRGLWTPQGLSNILDEVAKEARERGLRLAVDQEAQLLAQPVSFGTFSSLRLRVVIHLPLVHPEDSFRVMRWVNQPLHVDGWSGRGRPSLGATSDRLVVSPSGRRFVAHAEAQATWSRLTTSSYTCSHAPVTRDPTSEAATCLGALWRGRAQEVLQRCEIETAQPEVLESLGNNEWLACGNGTARLEVKCGSKLKVADHPIGCFRVWLKHACSLTIGGWSVRTRQAVEVPTPVLEVPAVALPRQLLTRLGANSSTSQEAQQLRAWRPGTVLHSARELHPVDLDDEFPLGTALLAGSGGLCALVSLVACWLIWRRWGRWCAGRTRTSRSGRPTTGSWGGADLGADPQARSLTPSERPGRNQGRELSLDEGSQRAVWTAPRGRNWEQRAVLGLLQALPDYQQARTLPRTLSPPSWRTPLPIAGTDRESLETTAREGSAHRGWRDQGHSPSPNSSGRPRRHSVASESARPCSSRSDSSTERTTTDPGTRGTILSEEQKVKNSTEEAEEPHGRVEVHIG